MRTKFFYPNKYGKIEFTEKELRQLLDEIYHEGYKEGRESYYTYTYTTPYRWTSSGAGTNINISDTSSNSGGITWTTTTNSENNDTVCSVSTGTNEACINTSSCKKYKLKI